MNLDYRHLFKLIEYTGLEEAAEEDPWDLHKLPVLDWDYCYFAFPFEDPIELALSDDHVFYPREVKDGFSLVINQENEMVPFFNIGDVVVCAPHFELDEGDLFIYRMPETTTFKFGVHRVLYKDDFRIGSLHQDDNGLLAYDDIFDTPIIAKIIMHYPRPGFKFIEKYKYKKTDLSDFIH